jgi:hypothetical protein
VGNLTKEEDITSLASQNRFLARVRVTSFNWQELMVQVHAIHLHVLTCTVCEHILKKVSSVMRYAAMTAIDRIALDDGSNAMVYVSSNE